VALLASAFPELEYAVASIAVPFAFVGRMFVVGRGLEFATAREVALKLTETCRVAAEPLTATDLAHGPIAALDPLFPVWTIASRDASLPAAVDAASRAREAGATILASGSAASEIAGAVYALPSRRRRTSCSHHSRRSCRVSSLRPLWPTRKVSTPTGRTG
jgi:glucosamine--fructose-6-phosphate aminotransferase (isomerizing)